MLNSETQQVQTISHDQHMDGRDVSTILVVEDETMVRLPIAEFLRDCGYNVLEAADASEAMAVVDSEPVDAVFSDVRMPGLMDGFGLAAWLRQHHPDVPVLLTSGWTGLSARASQAPREVKVIEKPYSQARVARHIEGMLRSAR